MLVGLVMEEVEDGEIHSPLSVELDSLSEESDNEDTDTIANEALKQLGNIIIMAIRHFIIYLYNSEFSDAIKEMFHNHHLRQLLIELDQSKEPGSLLIKAMEIPIFTEFADECLRICGLEDHRD